MDFPISKAPSASRWLASSGGGGDGDEGAGGLPKPGAGGPGDHRLGIRAPAAEPGRDRPPTTVEGATHCNLRGSASRIRRPRWASSCGGLRRNPRIRVGVLSWRISSGLGDRTLEPSYQRKSGPSRPFAASFPTFLSLRAFGGVAAVEGVCYATSFELRNDRSRLVS